MEMFELLMSSVVIVAIIGWLQGNKENKLSYITGERGIWRKELKECMASFQTSDIKDLDVWLVRLKINLNGYGCHNSGEYPEDMYLDFFRDEHIWKLIDSLETELRKSDCSEEKVNRDKEKIVQCVTILLKFDWERSKREVKVNKTVFISLGLAGMYLLAVCYFLVEYFQRMQADIYHIITSCITVVGVILIFFFLTWFPTILDQTKIIRERKWYRKTNLSFSWKAGIIGVGLIFLLLGGAFSRNSAFSVTSCVFIISCVIPIYQLASVHQFYTAYEQALIEILQIKELTVYLGVEDKESKEAMELLRSKGVNYRVEKNMKGFSKDPEFCKFMQENILTKVGIKKYHKVFKLKGSEVPKEEDGVLKFVSDNPAYCKIFFRYQTGDKTEYGKADKEMIKKWSL